MRFLMSIVAIIAVPIVAVAVAMILLGGGSRAASLPGAIFTTTADGHVVNENVRYNSKIEVYLDGGPGLNAPQHAAGLPDGLYVFQVTDPSGKVLLSEDPSKCRVVEVEDDVIVRLVPSIELGFPNNIYTVNSGKKGTQIIPCHIQDEPDGVPGPSGRHDTNTDVDHGPPAIVVQLMPFFNTPNPGGVYKAWMMPLDRYESNEGNLGAVPQPLKEKGKQIGYQRDAGFGPPRDQVKTDNFKVKEYFPPEITVRKFHDLNGNGVWDADEPEDEPEIGVGQCLDENWNVVPCPDGGWPYEFTEPVDGGSVTNTYYTPGIHVAGLPGDYRICELIGDDWVQTALYVDGVVLSVDPCTDLAIAGTSGEKHEVIFGDTQLGKTSGRKVIDFDADGVKDPEDVCPSDIEDSVNHPGCAHVEVCLEGIDNLGRTVGPECKPTDNNGYYEFTGLYPGTYRVWVIEPDEFHCSIPALNDCEYPDLAISSGGAIDDLDFGDFSLGEVHGVKFFDRNGNGERDAGEEGMPNIEIRLDGTQNIDLDDDGSLEVSLATHTCGDIVACPPGVEIGSYWFLDLVPGSYVVTEVTPDGLVQIAPDDGYREKLTSDEVCTGKDFANFGPCNGLTPGYWSNWRNHYTEAQFAVLLASTVATSIAEADSFLESLGCDDGDALHCMLRFLLADQLTLNLTQHPELPNPSDGSLIGACSIDEIGRLQSAIDDGLAILSDASAYSRDDILAVKNRLAAFAELR